MFYKIPTEILERSKQILMVLELTEFRWTILDILAQPEQELDAVMHLKAVGEKMRSQSRKKHDESMEQY